MKASEYRQSKAIGECPRCGGVPASGRVHCQGCLNDHKARYANQLPPEQAAHLRLVQAMQQSLPLVMPRAIEPACPQVACCGHWWTILQVPLRVPCCGRVFFAEDTA